MIYIIHPPILSDDWKQALIFWIKYSYRYISLKYSNTGVTEIEIICTKEVKMTSVCCIDVGHHCSHL